MYNAKMGCNVFYSFDLCVHSIFLVVFAIFTIGSLDFRSFHKTFIKQTFDIIHFFFAYEMVKSVQFSLP